MRTTATGRRVPSWTSIILKTVFCLAIAAALAFAGNARASYAKHPVQECHELASVAKTAQTSRAQGITIEQYIALVQTTIVREYYQQMYIQIGMQVYQFAPETATPRQVYDSVMAECLAQQPFI